jgi:hypothetical protein
VQTWTRARARRGALTTVEREELGRLRKQVKRLEMEREILKNYPRGFSHLPAAASARPSILCAPRPLFGRGEVSECDMLEAAASGAGGGAFGSGIVSDGGCGVPLGFGAGGRDAGGGVSTTTRSRRPFSPSLMTKICVTGACPDTTNRKTCLPGSIGNAAPSRLSVSADPSTLTFTALTSRPEPSLVSRMMVGCALSNSSNRRVQSARMRPGQEGSEHSWKRIRAMANLPSWRASWPVE